ncbi:MAG TPA: FG-GAP-like repeat-containing protein, partial [Puia sp.]|nr:FG-GAP-like repeat-containing protein [Puia sp.]
LRGDSLNRDGFGTKILLYQNGHVQSVEQYPVRGYASSVDPRLHFGLGRNSRPDSVTVIWPNGQTQHLQQVPIDTTLVLSEARSSSGQSPREFVQSSRRSSSRPSPGPSPDLLPRSALMPSHPAPLFADITDSLRVDYKHKETFFNDFAFNNLLPQKYSQLGPFISTGDIDGDGLTDFFVGGAYNQSGEIWLQQKKGGFIGKKLVQGAKYEEDMQSILVDVNGDHHPDLIVAGGSSEFDKDSRFLTPRLYLGDGKGNFTVSHDAFPAAVNTMAQSMSCTTSPLRIFLGGRVSLDYPYSPKSYLLEYRNGAFVDITQEVCPALSEAGMVTSSAWADLDGCGQEELIIAGDWMPVRVFKFRGGRLQEITDSLGLGHDLGMWKSLAVADVDGDGDVDIIAGNLGCNNPYNVSEETPMSLYAKDFEGNGRIDPLFCYYLPDEAGNKTLQLGVNLTQLTRRMPSMKKRFLKNADFARAGIAEQFPGEKLEEAIHLTCNELHTCWFENLGHGKFRKHILPIEAQFAPVNAVLARDLDGDGKLDLLLAGNEYQTEVINGRYDASYGLFLKGTGGGNFQPISHLPQGIFIQGDVKDIKSIKDGHGRDLILVAINNDRIRIFQPR